MTNQERADRGIASSNLCHHCHLYPESILHVLRDCEDTLELWEHLVKPNVWHLFASLGLDRWLEFNLGTADIGVTNYGWPILFGTMVHMLWIDHNHLVFSRKSVFPDMVLPKLFGQVQAIQLQLVKTWVVFH